MKIKRNEIDAAIATEVMQWDYRGSERRILRDRLERYHFSTDLNHAFEALEKWCGSNRSWNIESLVVMVCVGIYEPRVDEIGRYLITESTQDTTSLAICLALLSAVRGESVELEGDE